MFNGIKIIHAECDASLAEDKSLPYNTFLVEYLQDGITKFDLVSSSKKVDIFDHYYDNYRSDFIKMTQTQGRVNPRTWQDPNQKQKKKSK